MNSLLTFYAESKDTGGHQKTNRIVIGGWLSRDL